MALYTIRSGVSNHPEDTFLQHLTDLISSGGIVEGYSVSEPGGGGLNVDISTGRGFIKGSVGNAYPIRNTATETVEIEANNSGQPRITTIVAMNDLSAEPSEDGEGDDVHEIVAIDGTPAASPQAPSDSAIAAEIGSGNPFTRLADVLVENGASGISNSDITDKRRRPFFKSMNPMLTVAYAGTYAHDLKITNQFLMVLTGNLQLDAPTSMEIGDWMIARFVQDGTGGRTLTFGTGLTGKSADVSIAPGANQTSTYAIQKVGSALFDVFLVGKDY